MSDEKCPLCQGYGLVAPKELPAIWPPCPNGCPQPKLYEGPIYYPFPEAEKMITKSAGSWIHDGWTVGDTIRIMSSKKGVQFWAERRHNSKYAARRWAYLVRHGLAYIPGVITAIVEDTLTVTE